MTANILWAAIYLGELVCALALILILASFFERK